MAVNTSIKRRTAPYFTPPVEGEDTIYVFSSDRKLKKMRSRNLPTSLTGDPSLLQARQVNAAAQAGDLEHLNELLDQGANPNIVNGSGETPLHIASKKGNLEMVRALLDFGADLNLLNARSETALAEAVIQQYQPVVELLLEIGSVAPKQQKVGNCVLISPKAAIRFAWIMLLKEQGVDQPFEMGRRESKAFTDFAAQYVLEEFGDNTVDGFREMEGVAQPLETKNLRIQQRHDKGKESLARRLAEAAHSFKEACMRTLSRVTLVEVR